MATDIAPDARPSNPFHSHRVHRVHVDRGDTCGSNHLRNSGATLVERWKQDAAADLQQVEARIKTNRKSAYNTANPKTAAIADATLPSLERKAAALRLELETLTDRPSHVFNYQTFVGGPDTECWPNGLAKATWPTGVFDMELAEIPEMLRR